VYLAAKLALPLVPVGVGYDRPWRAKSWDHFAVPRPFSRARIIFGPAIPVPPDLDRPGLERCRDQVEGLLERLTGAAETWAASGSHLPGELMLRRLLGPWPNGNLGTIRPQPAVMGSGAANGRGLSGGDDAAARSF